MGCDSLHQDRQFSEQPLSVALSAPESIPHVLLPRHSQHGGTVRLTIFLYGLRRKDAGPILQHGDSSGKFRRRIWGIGGRSLHRHIVFQQRYLLHELVFACSHPTPQRPRISYTILNQANWCAVWTVARGDLDVFQFVNALEMGACVVW